MLKVVPWQDLFDDTDPVFWRLFNSPDPAWLQSEDKKTEESPKE